MVRKCINHQKLINLNRAREFGSSNEKDFSKDYEPETKWFFVKNNGKIVSFAGLRPIVIDYLGKKYEIEGICSFISIVKGKGYGKELVSRLIEHSKRTGKSLLGFTGKTEFFGKVGLETKKDFIKRFVYVKNTSPENGVCLGVLDHAQELVCNSRHVNPKTKERVIDEDGDGIFYRGSEGFIDKVLSTDKLVEINVLHW